MFSSRAPIPHTSRETSFFLAVVEDSAAGQGVKGRRAARDGDTERNLAKALPETLTCRLTRPDLRPNVRVTVGLARLGQAQDGSGLEGDRVTYPNLSTKPK